MELAWATTVDAERPAAMAALATLGDFIVVGGSSKIAELSQPGRWHSGRDGSAICWYAENTG